ncbi:uncharacterized protein LOC129586100 [Paramacrobiotus metropolitanus]|uniref:uncharacterized protein LOC129586100 n=1 Tax=Paramacrobiotus metropolitanus TaxID=2943436 RepID=UPI002446502C|nr:uncharacterized protein LOC129586100 [Paramacrobiotus metropolitanus]
MLVDSIVQTPKIRKTRWLPGLPRMIRGVLHPDVYSQLVSHTENINLWAATVSRYTAVFLLLAALRIPCDTISALTSRVYAFPHEPEETRFRKRTEYLLMNVVLPGMVYWLISILTLCCARQIVTKAQEVWKNPRLFIESEAVCQQLVDACSQLRFVSLPIAVGPMLTFFEDVVLIDVNVYLGKEFYAHIKVNRLSWWLDLGQVFFWGWWERLVTFGR